MRASVQRKLSFSIYFCLHLFAEIVVSSSAYAQRTTGSISGRVVAEDGQPMSRVAVMILAGGQNVMKTVMGGSSRQMTDSEGRFQADGLEAAAYQITVNAPGYVMPQGNEPDKQPVYRLGDTPTIVMRKGGVITGRVTDTAGRSLVGVIVAAELADGGYGTAAQTLSLQIGGLNQMPRTTDDRGQFRLYGLSPGRYVVLANPAALMADASNPFRAQPATYHPSATRDGATIVNVIGGSESGGVNIRFRGGAGFAVSGKLKGMLAGDGMISNLTTIQLKAVNADDILATTVILPMLGSDGFAFYGIPNGDYELIAQQLIFKDQSTQRSAPVRVTVNNADVTNLSLTLSAMATINGKLALVSSSSAAAATACKDARASKLDEVALRLERAPFTKKSTALRLLLGEAAQGFADENHAFRFTGLATGTFWLTPDLPSPHWYVKALAAEKTATVSATNGIALKAGEKLSNLTLTLATDGAQLQGRVIAADKARQVFLVPAETEAPVHRFAETVSANDGGFAFASIAPGKYWLVTRPAAKPDEAPRQPLAWDATERAKLVKEAVAANQAVELKACQSLKQQEIKLP